VYKRLEGSTAKSKSVPCRPIQTPETCPAFSCLSFSVPPPVQNAAAVNVGLLPELIISQQTQ